MVAHFWTMSDRSADNFDYFKFNWAGGAAYELRKDTEIYAEYSGKFVNEKVTTESYDRTRVGAGIRVKFMTRLPSAAIGNR
jgi:predicted porin